MLLDVLETKKKLGLGKKEGKEKKSNPFQGGGGGRKRRSNFYKEKK